MGVNVSILGKGIAIAIPGAFVIANMRSIGLGDDEPRHDRPSLSGAAASRDASGRLCRP
jgi:hypothetical protein